MYGSGPNPARGISGSDKSSQRDRPSLLSQGRSSPPFEITIPPMPLEYFDERSDSSSEKDTSEATAAGLEEEQFESLREEFMRLMEEDIGGIDGDEGSEQ